MASNDPINLLIYVTVWIWLWSMQTHRNLDILFNWNLAKLRQIGPKYTDLLCKFFFFLKFGSRSQGLQISGPFLGVITTCNKSSTLFGHLKDYNILWNICTNRKGNKQREELVRWLDKADRELQFRVKHVLTGHSAIKTLITPNVF